MNRRGFLALLPFVAKTLPQERVWLSEVGGPEYIGPWNVRSIQAAPRSSPSFSARLPSELVRREALRRAAMSIDL